MWGWGNASTFLFMLNSGLSLSLSLPRCDLFYFRGWAGGQEKRRFTKPDLEGKIQVQVRETTET